MRESRENDVGAMPMSPMVESSANRRRRSVVSGPVHGLLDGGCDDFAVFAIISFDSHDAHFASAVYGVGKTEAMAVMLAGETRKSCYGKQY